MKVTLDKKTPRIIILFLILTFTCNAEQLNSLVTYNMLDKQYNAQLMYLKNKQCDQKYGISVFSFYTKNYSKFLLGYQVDINSFTLTFNGGIETTPSLLRYGFNLFYINNKVTLLSIYDGGLNNGDYFYTNSLLFNVRQFSMGIGITRYIGIGPEINYSISNKCSLKFGCAIDYEFNNKNVYSGITLNI